MKQKLFTLLLTITATFGTLSAEIIERVQIGDLYYNLDTENQTAEVTYRYNLTAGEADENYPSLPAIFTMPDKVEYNDVTYSVTSIGYSAFNYCTIQEVTIPNSIKSIGSWAFYGCNSMISVVIPNNVASIGGRAFGACGLTTVEIQNTVTSIGNGAFHSCNNLAEIKVALDNPNYSSLEGVLFNKDQSVILAYPAGKESATYTLPESIVRIEEEAFRHCNKLQSVTIGDKVTTIGEDAFYGCENMEEITLGNSVQTIERSAFGYCVKLNAINLPNSLISIGEDAFVNCALKFITIPVNVTSIGRYAFYSCDSLTSVVWNARYYVHNEYDYAYVYDAPFYSISEHITSFTFGEEVETIPAGLCEGMKLTEVIIPNSVKSIEMRAFCLCRDLESVTLGEGLTTIGMGAFGACEKLQSIALPESLKDLGESAFAECRNLESITLGKNITSIEDYTFYECESLKEITIPNSVTSIGYNAFIDCDNLETVTIGNGVVEIAEKAFHGCKKMETLVIGSAVTTIGDDAFSGCKSLMSIYNYAVTPQPISNIVFDISYKDANDAVDKSVCVLYVPENSIDLYKKADVWKEFSNIQAITDEETAIENPSAKFGGSRKLLRDGQILILRGDKTYTLTGQEVR